MKRADYTKYVASLGFPVDDVSKWMRKYYKLRGNVPLRGVELKLSFLDYITLAKEAGITDPDQIGSGRGKYQIGRIGDSGNYEIGNCRFITKEQNLLEMIENGGTQSHARKISKRYVVFSQAGKGMRD